MLPERANAICILEILKEYSDPEHILTMKELIFKMKQIYDIEIDRRTVYSAMSLLKGLGYDISRYEENKVGYYLRSRNFEQSEILLLTDAIYTFPFIPKKQSEDLIKKLQKQLSVHKRKEYKHLTLVRSEKKTDNKQIFWNIEQLDVAIGKKKQVSFIYCQYGLDKKLHPRREKAYVVNPYGMVFMNEHYYLVCNYVGLLGTNLYRIDRMKDISILDTAWNKKLERKTEILDAVYAFTGETEYVTMYCDNIILSDVIDKFGTSVFVTRLDDTRFKLRFKAPLGGVKFWALQYLPYVEVVEPQWLRDEVIDSIKNNKYLNRE